MSQENVDLYLEARDRLVAEDFDGFARLLHPEVSTTALEGWPEPGPHHGRDAVRAALERIVAEFDEQRFTDTEVVVEHDDWTVIAYRWRVRGSGSGLETHFDLVVAFRVIDAQLIEMHFRWTADDALDAAGLRE